VDEAVEEMDAVTLEDLQRVAAEVLDPRRAYLGVVGPYKSSRKFAALLPN
jgi:predicted Zn-dependent peptidase